MRGRDVEFCDAEVTIIPIFELDVEQSHFLSVEASNADHKTALYLNSENDSWRLSSPTLLLDTIGHNSQASMRQQAFRKS